MLLWMESMITTNICAGQVNLIVPTNNEFQWGHSVIPDRFHSTTRPAKGSIVSGDLNSRTRIAKPQSSEGVQTPTAADRPQPWQEADEQ